MKNSIIRCDFCEKQLNEKGPYPHNWGLHLASVDFKEFDPKTIMVYAVTMSPNLDRDYDFCGMVCLSKWITKRMNDI